MFWDWVPLILENWRYSLIFYAGTGTIVCCPCTSEVTTKGIGKGIINKPQQNTTKFQPGAIVSRFTVCRQYKIAAFIAITLWHVKCSSMSEVSWNVMGFNSLDNWKKNPHILFPFCIQFISWQSKFYEWILYVTLIQMTQLSHNFAYGTTVQPLDDLQLCYLIGLSFHQERSNDN